MIWTLLRIVWRKGLTWSVQRLQQKTIWTVRVNGVDTHVHGSYERAVNYVEQHVIPVYGGSWNRFGNQWSQTADPDGKSPGLYYASISESSEC